MQIPTIELLSSAGIPRYIVQGSEVTGWTLFYQNPFLGLVPLGTYRKLEEAKKKARLESRKRLN